MATTRRSLLVGSALFLGLAGLGVAWSLRRAGPQLPDLPELSRWQWGWLVVLVPAIYGLDALRYRVLGRAAGAPMGWGAALEASTANFFFSWLTPGAALGAPAAVVTLRRRGITLAAASLIAFGKSMTGTLVLLLLAFLALALGLGPAFSPAVVIPLAVGAGVVVGVLALPVLAAAHGGLRGWLQRARPGWRGRLGSGLGDAAARLARLRLHDLGWIFLSHFAYFVAFVGVAVVLVSAFGATPMSHVVGASTVFTAFTYVAPTPGGAGLSEGAADLFFAGLLAPGPAVAAVLIFRALTFYLQVVVGLIYLVAAGGRRILDVT